MIYSHSSGKYRVQSAHTQRCINGLNLNQYFYPRCNLTSVWILYFGRYVFATASLSDMNKTTNLWKFELNIGRRSCEIGVQEEKKPCHTKLFAFRLVFGTSLSNAEVSISNSWKITSFSKTTLFQRGLFLTMFYTINSSPLLVTK